MLEKEALESTFGKRKAYWKGQDLLVKEKPIGAIRPLNKMDLSSCLSPGSFCSVEKGKAGFLDTEAQDKWLLLGRQQLSNVIIILQKIILWPLQ